MYLCKINKNTSIKLSRTPEENQKNTSRKNVKILSTISVFCGIAVYEYPQLFSRIHRKIDLQFTIFIVHNTIARMLNHSQNGQQPPIVLQKVNSPNLSPAALSAIIQTDRQCSILQTELTFCKTMGGCSPFYE